MADRKVTIALSPVNIGLTLNAQLVDDAGVNVGAVISAGFVEMGGGGYMLTHTFTDAFVGGIKIFEQGIPATVLASAGVDFLVIDRQRSDHNILGVIAESYSGLESGAAIAGTLDNENMSTDLTNSISGAFVNRHVVWITGTLTNQAALITAYNGTTFTLTYLPVTASPLVGDRFVIV